MPRAGRLSPLFWQYLMAGELPVAKSREIVRSLGASYVDPVSYLLSSRLLSPAEKRNVGRADLRGLERALEQGVAVLEEEDYPETLQQSLGSPPALFAWGDLSALRAPMVGIVGTRGPSAYGKAVAWKFAEALAAAGVTVVSGGAMGIDAQAHEGALAAGGKTVAVLGNGLDRAQPARNADLFERVRASGCLLSQFAVGAPSLSHHFPARNHLIAALSMGVLVVEAPERSGALITASAAAELGRLVFVVPATINNFGFRGSHALIRDGASLVDHPDQVLEALGIEGGASAAPAGPDLTDAQNRIMAALTTDPQPAESIAAVTGLPPSELLDELTMLELEGLVLREPTGYAIKP